LDLEPLLRRLENCTPGPWRRGATVQRTIYKGLGPDDLIGVMDSKEDAYFVTKARNELPDLIKVLSGYQRALEIISTGAASDPSTLSLEWAQHVATTALESWGESE
jgi:hypothetical protein